MHQEHTGPGDNVGRNKIVNYITQQSGERKIPKWLTNCPRFDEKLIGRTEDMKRLAQMLEERKSVVLVNGMGGIGKTTLAIAYLDAFKDEYDHVVWLEQLGDFPETLLTNELLLRNLDITSVAEDPEKQAQQILNKLGNITGNCLMVIDNADHRLQPYRSHLPRDWRVLVTSRAALDFSATFDLDFLEEDDAVQLFYAHYKHKRDDDLVRKIITAVERHTLTIELLAKTATRKRRTLPLDKLWQHIQARGLALGKTIDLSNVGHSGHENIEKLFPYLCSIFELQNLSEAETSLLKHLVCLPPTFHTFDELKDLLQIDTEETIEQLEDALQQLKEKGWLLTDEIADAYKIHRIVLDVVNTQLEIKEEDVALLVTKLIRVTNYGAGQNPVKLFPLIPYGKQLLSIIGDQFSENMGRLYDNIARLYQEQGRYEEALNHYQKAIAIREDVLDKKHPDLATSYNNIGLLYKARGNYDEALNYFQNAVVMREALPDKLHPDLATFYNNIANLYQAQGRYDEALNYCQKAIAIDEAVLDEQHPDLAASYNNIGLVYYYQGRYEDALSYYQKAIGIREAVLDKQHPDLAISYNNIAGLYKAQGRYEESLNYYQKTITIEEAVLDEQHPDLAISYNNFAGLHEAQGRYDEALNYYQKAIAILQTSLGEQHPHTQTVKRNLELLKAEIKKE